MPHRNLIAIALVGVASLLCWRSSQAEPRDEMLELYGLFVDAVEQVESNYVRPVSRRDLLESALQGMLQDLDPHSDYFSQTRWNQFKKTFEGSFTGIGIQVEVDPQSKRLKVLAPLIGTPAYESGILAGDLILEVDGESTEGITLDKAVELLQGRPGTSVELVVLHKGTKEAETIQVTREIIESESVLGTERKADDNWEFFIDPDEKIAYLRVTGFYQTTAEDIRKVLNQLQRDELNGLILDLRTNPGGLLSSAVEVSDLFVDSGTIVSTKGRNTRERRFTARRDGTLSDLPMVVLVNRHSASAAEIVAACLQDHDRAKVIGERSFGKGSVQNILELDGGASFLKLTVETYFRPSGKNIHKFPDAKEEDEWGVSPDDGLEIRLSEDDYVAWERQRRVSDQNSRIPNPRNGQDQDDDEDDSEKAAKDVQIAKALEVLRDSIEKAKEVKAARN